MRESDKPISFFRTEVKTGTTLQFTKLDLYKNKNSYNQLDKQKKYRLMENARN